MPRIYAQPGTSGTGVLPGAGAWVKQIPKCTALIILRITMLGKLIAPLPIRAGELVFGVTARGGTSSSEGM